MHVSCFCQPLLLLLLLLALRVPAAPAILLSTASLQLLR